MSGQRQRQKSKSIERLPLEEKIKLLRALAGLEQTREKP